MKTIYGNLKDLKQYLKSNEKISKCPILLRSIKTELPLAAYVPNGCSGGWIYTRRTIKKTKHQPSHNFNNSIEAYKILFSSVFK